MHNSANAKQRVQSFLEYIEETLIPDLKEAGSIETSKDIEQLLSITIRLQEKCDYRQNKLLEIKKLHDKAGDIVRYLPL
tara:strand:+ start:199 stop:435 length:237 start_codon:yes stop_codon:yes gene_type:complete